VRQEALFTLLIVVALFLPHTVNAQTVVISQIYSGGGNQETSLTNDFIELFNAGNDSVGLDGWTVQYSSASGSLSIRVDLAGSLAPGQYYLIQAGGTTSLPTPDVISGVGLSAINGKVALVASTTTLETVCPNPFPSFVVDFVGYGTANCAEGTGASDLTNTTALLRAVGGCRDTDNNASDFIETTPAPRNSSTWRSACHLIGRESFSLTDRGGTSTTSQGTAGTTTVGYGRIRPDAGMTTPTGLAIFGFTQNGVLVSEAGVPAAAPIQQGRIFAEVNGPVNTGLAIANPNDTAATITFYFTDVNGVNFGNGTFTLGANQQTAKFLDQDPFDPGTTVLGTFTFTSSVPISVVALRGFTNERTDFLISTLPIVPISSSSTSTIYFPHFADGGGWATQVVLVNPTESTITGNIEFLDQGSGTTAATPVALTMDDSSVGSTFHYHISPRSAQRFTTSNPAGGTSVGSVRATPDIGSTSPSGVGIFSFISGGVTVSEAGVLALPEASAFRVYVEASGTPGAIDSVRSGLAITDTSGTTNSVTLELTDLDGTTVGAAEVLSIPPSGQVAKFLNEFFTLPGSFAGILRVTSTADVAILGLRARTNQRGDFMITTTPPTNEVAAPTSVDTYFPHLADSGGWSTQVVLFSGTAGQASSGTLSFIDQTGLPLDLSVSSAANLPAVLSVTLNESPGALVASLSVSLDRPGPIEVDYWTDGTPRLRVRVTNPEIALHNVLLARLISNAAYRFSVRSLSTVGERSIPTEGQFSTEELPADLAAVQFAVEGESTDPLTVLELRTSQSAPSSTFAGYVVVDKDGNVVWYWRLVGAPHGWTRRANGNFVFLDAYSKLIEVSTDGRVISQLTRGDLPEGALPHHDLAATENNTVLFLLRNQVDVDGLTLGDEQIWEWNPEAGSVEKRFASFDFFPPEEYETPRTTPAEDWFHGNSLRIGPRGNIVLSYHHLNKIVSVASDFQSIEWHLGGINSTFTLSTAAVFTGQHTAAELASGNILLFDNGFERIPGDQYSRALELELDFLERTAEVAWEFRATPDNYAPFISSAVRQANGNTFVAFGVGAREGMIRGPIAVYETTQEGRVLWHLEVLGETRTMFRATPLNNIGGEMIVSEPDAP